MISGQPSKKSKTSHVDMDQLVEVEAVDVIQFHFGGSGVPVCPEFVHQNFGQSGKILWVKHLLPLSVNIHVDIRNGLVCTVSIAHGGDARSAEAAELQASLIDKLATPCDLGEGCAPAVYPGDLTGSGSTSSASTPIAPSAVHTVDAGYTIEQYSASDLQGKSLDVWKRVEWLMLWFIESVSQSDHSHDPNWEYYLMKNSEGDILSMCSCYKFPSFQFVSQGFIGERVRLSQFLTIPTQRNSGNGSILLRFLADTVLARSDVDRLTMEDPSLGMMSARESVYLRIAKELGLLAHRDPSVEDIQSALKIPRSFAKRIQCLLELNTIRGQKPVNEILIDKVISSDNKFVKKFINSIEFFDDEEVGEGDDPRTLTKGEMDQLVRERVEEAMRKLQKLGA